MKSLLITGFDPFGGETVNPAWEAVSRLPDIIGQWQLTKLQIPTVFAESGAMVLKAAEALRPDAVICVGQAGGRSAITPEVVAINLQEARIADNKGNQPVNVPVIAGGPAAYFSTLPVREMVQAMVREGLPAALSYSAGAFVCNDVMYRLAHHYHGAATRTGFIHVPYLPEQAGENVPAMTLAQMVQALTAAISAL